MSSQEDLETKLNTHNAGGGVLLDPSTQVVSASIASLQERHLYEVLRLWPRGCCIKVSSGPFRPGAHTCTIEECKAHHTFCI